MKECRSWSCWLCGIGALLLALAVPVAAASDASPAVIKSGVDMWVTPNGGSTFSNFESDPIPAGFFCEGSKPFTGRIAWTGMPLQAEPKRALGDVDTLVKRLDNATFDVNGEAHTRLQMLALSLKSVEPFDSGCGLYNAYVRLDGEQQQTEMRIVRTMEMGGYFIAPLALHTKVIFEPLPGQPGERRELKRYIELGPGSTSVWSIAKAPEQHGYVKVDADHDGSMDTLVPMDSEFAAGMAPAGMMQLPQTGNTSSIALAQQQQPSCPCGYCPYTTCHCDPSSDDPFTPPGDCQHLHCQVVCVPSGSVPPGGEGIACMCVDTLQSP